jgi:hypothetical protein
LYGLIKTPDNFELFLGFFDSSQAQDLWIVKRQIASPEKKEVIYSFLSQDMLEADIIVPLDKPVPIIDI